MSKRNQYETIMATLNQFQGNRCAEGLGVSAKALKQLSAYNRCNGVVPLCAA
jgi:hypothetical protein